jgi:hypothetical protein
MDVSELEGAELDAAVARALGWEKEGGGWWTIKRNENGGALYYSQGLVHEFRPSTDWSDGGPIIERERIALTCHAFGGGAYLDSVTELWNARTLGGLPKCGPTPLIAAMRAFVAAEPPERSHP